MSRPKRPINIHTIDPDEPTGAELREMASACRAVRQGWPPGTTMKEARVLELLRDCPLPSDVLRKRLNISAGDLHKRLSSLVVQRSIQVIKPKPPNPHLYELTSETWNRRKDWEQRKNLK